MRALSAIGFILSVQACFVSVDDFPVATTQLGDACDDSKPCPPDLECWGANETPGAPGGMCTKTCVTPDDCPSGSNCVDVAGRRTCLAACEFRVSDASKCRGRRELGCTEQNSCVPLCSKDAHCDGRYCDLELGLCVDEPSTGNPPNTLCGMDYACRGECVEVGPLGYCEERCVLGSVAPCATAGSDANLDCVDMYDLDAAIGDVGQCAPTCNCADAGCGDGEFRCVKVGSQQYCLRFGPDVCLI